MTEQALSEEEPHFCTNCGSPINSTDKFCTNCGAPIQRGSVAASDSGEAQASGDGNSEQAGAYGEAQAAQPVEPVAPTDATPVAAAVPAPVAAAAEVTSAVEQAVSEAEQAANTAQPTVSAAVAMKKPRKKAGAIAAAIVGILVIASMLIILGLMQLNVLANPFAKARPVTFAIKAPHYNEKTDSKIPLHITGKTVSGKVISQHVYVSPKAPVVHLAPGQYTVQVEASPLLSSGDVYRIPEPIKIDTTKDNRLVGESKPVKQDLKFEVKPANEVTASDLQAVAKFAKKTATPVKKLDFLNEKIRRQKVATAFNSVLDMLSKENAEPFDVMLGESARYSLLDIDQDGTPELFTWNGRNGGRTLAKEQPVGCGERQDDFSGSRVWKYDSEHDRAQCLSGDSLSLIKNTLSGLDYSSSRKVLSSYQNGSNSHFELTLVGDKVKISQVEDPNSTVASSDGDITYISVFSTILDRDLLSVLAMKVPSSLSAKPIENYDQYALKVSNAVMNGQQVFSGTVRLMTPQQVQDFQHQYVVDHQLNFNYDPASTNPESWMCQTLGNNCGNPAGLANGYTDKLMVFIPEGKRTITGRFIQQDSPLPLYIYPIAYSASSRACGFSEQDCSEEYFRNYDNKRVILTSSLVSWGQSVRELPWAQPSLYDADVLLTLSH